MNNYESGIPKREMLDKFEVARDSTARVLRPFVELAKGAIVGAAKGSYAGAKESWNASLVYLHDQREIDELQASDFLDRPAE